MKSKIKRLNQDKRAQLPSHRVRGIGLDGRAALGAAVEGEVDARLGLLQRQGQPEVALAEGPQVQRPEGPAAEKGELGCKQEGKKFIEIIILIGGW